MTVEGLRYALIRVQTICLFAALRPLTRIILAYDRWMADRRHDAEASRFLDQP